jgi:hypothetical protein
MVFLIQKVTLPTIKLIKFIILATIVCFCALASYAQNPVTKPPVLIKDSVTYWKFRLNSPHLTAPNSPH